MIDKEAIPKLRSLKSIIREGMGRFLKGGQGTVLNI
jgi:hypothetical protein